MLKVRFSGTSLVSNGSGTSTNSDYDVRYNFIKQKEILDLLGKKILDNLFKQLAIGTIKKSNVSYIARRMKVVTTFDQESLTFQLILITKG